MATRSIESVGRGKINPFTEEELALLPMTPDLGHFRQSSNLASIDLNRLEDRFCRLIRRFRETT